MADDVCPVCDDVPCVCATDPVDCGAMSGHCRCWRGTGSECCWCYARSPRWMPRHVDTREEWLRDALARALEAGLAEAERLRRALSDADHALDRVDAALNAAHTARVTHELTAADEIRALAAARDRLMRERDAALLRAETAEDARDRYLAALEGR